MIKKIVSNKFFIATLFFVLGIYTNKFYNLLNHFNFLTRNNSFAFTLGQNSPNSSDDFLSDNPFDEMERLQKSMLHQFNQQLVPKDSLGGNEISQHEDNDFVYYEINLSGKAPKDFNVEVKNGQININGRAESKSDTSNSVSYFSSSFHRSFPTPEGVNEDKLQMEQSGEKIILKFPKKPKS